MAVNIKDLLEIQASRRALLKSVGGLAITMPFARSLAFAQAAGSTGPLKRLVLLCGEAGGASAWWRPQGGEFDWSIDFDGATLKPLSALRSKLLIVNGVGNYIGSRNFGGVENHEARSVTFTAWTNSKPGDPNASRGPSVDRAIIEALGESQPLYANIGSPVQGPGSEYYYAGPGSPISGVGTVTGIYDALFSNAVVKNSGARLYAATEGAMAPSLSTQKMFLEQQMKDAKILRERLGADARRKLDEYLTTLDARLKALMGPGSTGTVPPGTGSGNTGNMGGQTVSKPNRPGGNPNYNQPLPINGPYTVIDNEFDLVADGLILGVTQVACLRLAHSIFEEAFLRQNVGGRTVNDYHQDVAHQQGVGDQHKNNAANLTVRAVQTAQARCVERFLKRLDSARDSDGSSVLDNTLFVWTTQMGDQSSHLSARLPYVLAGGLGEKAGTLKMGRYLDFAPSPISNAEQMLAINTAVASNVLLNTVQKTFGINRDGFGEVKDAKCRGYLPRAT